MTILSGPETALEKPCLVDTGRGFSVSYKNRLLYSKYAPEKTILSVVSDLKILPGTLFVISSPALWYGLETLIKKLPENCFILAIEAEKALYDFSLACLDKIVLKNPEIKEKIMFLPPEKLDYIVNIIFSGTDFPPLYNFRRAVYLEFSGGSAFHRELYQKISFQAQNTIGSFWKNRLTLTKLGRLYSRNIFRNLSQIPYSIDFSVFKGKISRPIFIFGAGESTVETLRTISKKELEKCFVLCVDAALPVLSAFQITPDAVVAVEGQLAIEKAYIGNARFNSILFADMDSRTSVLKHSSKGFSFFSSRFTQAKFLSNLESQNFFPAAIPALGSVGLTASYLALLLRKSDEIPLFASGLDFDFSLGKTHAQNAPAHIARLIKSNRLKKIANYDAAFKPGAKKVGNSGGKDFFTDISLSGYAESFKDTFSAAKNFFNCTDFGLNIGLPFVSANQVNLYLCQHEKKSPHGAEFVQADKIVQNKRKNEIIKYLENEKDALEKIKNLLANGKNSNETQEDFEKKLDDLISEREYLFLHFPDGYKCDTKNISFLKRVRSEIDFFLKDIKKSINCLKS